MAKIVLDRIGVSVRPRIRLALLISGLAIIGIAVGSAGADDTNDGQTRAPTEPDVAQQYRDWDPEASGAHEGAIAMHEEAIETGFARISMRGVANGRVSLDLFFSAEPTQSKGDLGPVFDATDDELVAYYGSSIGVVTLAEYDALETQQDFDQLAAELEGLAGCNNPELCN